MLTSATPLVSLLQKIHPGFEGNSIETLVQAIRKGRVQVLCARPGFWLSDPSLVAAMEEQNATNPIRLVVGSSTEQLAKGEDVVSHVATTNHLRSLARNSTFVLSMGDVSPALIDQALVAAKLPKRVVSWLPRPLPSNVGLYSLAVERDHDKYAALCAFLRDNSGRKMIRVPSALNVLPMANRLTGSGFHVAAMLRQPRGIVLPFIDSDLIDACKHNIIVVAGDHGYDSLVCSDIRHVIHYGSPVSARSVYRGMVAAGIAGHSSSYTALFSTTGTISFRQQLLSRIPSLRGTHDLICEIFNDGVRSRREGESFHIDSRSLCHRYEITRGAFNKDVLQVFRELQWGIFQVAVSWAWQQTLEKVPRSEEDLGHLVQAVHRALCRPNEELLSGRGFRPATLLRLCLGALLPVCRVWLSRVVPRSVSSLQVPVYGHRADSSLVAHPVCALRCYPDTQRSMEGRIGKPPDHEPTYLLTQIPPAYPHAPPPLAHSPANVLEPGC